jgi:hypothetical protein
MTCSLTNPRIREKKVAMAIMNEDLRIDMLNLLFFILLDKSTLRIIDSKVFSFWSYFAPIAPTLNIAKNACENRK